MAKDVMKKSEGPSTSTVMDVLVPRVQHRLILQPLAVPYISKRKTPALWISVGHGVFSYVVIFSSKELFSKETFCFFGEGCDAASFSVS